MREGSARLAASILLLTASTATYRVPLSDQCARSVALEHPVIAERPNPRSVAPDSGFDARPLVLDELAARTALELCRWEQRNPVVAAQWEAARREVPLDRAHERG